MTPSDSPTPREEGWKREGFTIYELTQDGWRKGEPVMVNRWNASVQGSRFCQGDDLEAVARLVHAAPDLAEALEQLLAVAEMTTFSDQFPGQCEQARAALSRANAPEAK